MTTTTRGRRRRRHRPRQGVKKTAKKAQYTQAWGTSATWPLRELGTLWTPGALGTFGALGAPGTLGPTRGDTDTGGHEHGGTQGDTEGHGRDTGALRTLEKNFKHLVDI